jgi:DNA-binding SARP family transcriptional activator
LLDSLDDGRQRHRIVLRLLTFGGLSIEADDGTASPRLRPPRLALLAVLAAAGDRGMSRERLAALFWPDADEQRARHSLRQARYALRTDLGLEVVQLEGGMLSLVPEAITSDVTEFHAALARGDGRHAVSLARGAFLDGFYLAGAAEFERWVEDERARLHAVAISTLVALASETRDRDEAVEWWRQLTLREPLSGRFAIGYLKSLATRGDRAEALAFVRQHEALVRRELETDPDPEVQRLEAELRATQTRTPARPATIVSDLSSERIQQTVIADIAATPTLPAEVPTGPVLRSVGPRPRRLAAVLAIGAVALTGVGAIANQRGWLPFDAQPVLAVGLIREDSSSDSTHSSGVLTDMLATNLARIEGLAVLANSRLLEIMQPARDSSVGYADAARRAGASELLEGRLTSLPTGGLELEMRRVELRRGIVRDVYRAHASSRGALVDSMTQLVARQFRLPSPPNSIVSATTASPVAYRLYEEGLRLKFQGEPRSAMRLMHAALEEDSTFALAAYHEVDIAANLGDARLPDGQLVSDARQTVLRLASRAPERERLMIRASILTFLQEPEALAVADSLATRFPTDPRAFETLGNARWTAGDWAGSVEALNRAIALDSIVETNGGSVCRVCLDFYELEQAYAWWDSLDAAVRTQQRHLRLQPKAHHPWYALALIGARRGDSAAAYDAYRRMVAISGGDVTHAKLRIDLLLGLYENVERDARPLLASSAAREWSDGETFLLLALRNQGRLRDAFELHRTGWLPGFPAVPQSPNDFDAGILALESGDARGAAAIFRDKAHRIPPGTTPGNEARVRTWNLTLAGTALATAGDTTAVRALVDSVERSGRGSAYGRDQKLHHYLRGLLFAAQRRDEDAVREFRAAIHSPNFGFTRVNYELARALLRLGRPTEAVATLQSSLRGEVDASNLYITRTDLHELLADAFYAAGQPDSAAAHYRAVATAWRKADPMYHARRARALARVGGMVR